MVVGGVVVEVGNDGSLIKGGDGCVEGDGGVEGGDGGDGGDSGDSGDIRDCHG